MVTSPTEFLRRYADPEFCDEREFLLEGERIITQAREIRKDTYLALQRENTEERQEAYERASETVNALRERQVQFDAYLNRELNRFDITPIEITTSLPASVVVPVLMEPTTQAPYTYATSLDHPTLITYLSQQFGEQHRDLLNMIGNPEHQRALQEATHLYNGAISSTSEHQAVNAAALRRYVDRTIMSTPLEKEADLNSGIALRGIANLFLTDILQRERDRPVQ